jgi:hypothetical protein
MKKVIFALAILFLVTATVSSCKSKEDCGAYQGSQKHS